MQVQRKKLDTDSSLDAGSKRRDTDCRGYALEQLLQSTIIIIQTKRKIAEKLEIYSVALRFQTTDGCSSSFAKDIEVKLLTNQKTI